MWHQVPIQTLNWVQMWILMLMTCNLNLVVAWTVVFTWGLSRVFFQWIVWKQQWTSQKDANANFFLCDLFCTPPQFNMVHLKISPWQKEIPILETLILSGSMLNFWGVSCDFCFIRFMKQKSSFKVDKFAKMNSLRLWWQCFQVFFELGVQWQDVLRWLDLCDGRSDPWSYMAVWIFWWGKTCANKKNAQHFGVLPSREVTYPTLGKGKSSSKCHFWGIC